MQSTVISVEQCAFNPRFPDTASYRVMVEGEERSVFSPGYEPKVGETIEYELVPTHDGTKQYFRIVLSEAAQQVVAASVPSTGYKPAGGGWQPRRMLPPLSPEEAVDVFTLIAQRYVDSILPKEVLNFTSEDHRNILISLFISATKPREYYEENVNVE